MILFTRGACGGSVLTGLGTPTHWQARPRAELVLAPDTRHMLSHPIFTDRAVSKKVPKRQALVHTLTLHHPLQPPATLRSPPVSGSCPLLVSAQKL